MSQLALQRVRDIYPDALQGRMDAELARRVRDHVAECDTCAAECAIVADLHARVPEVPAGLQERIVKALREPRRRPFVRPVHLAMAATVAVALIGGALLFQAQQTPEPQKQPVAQNALHVGAVGVDATMLSGKTSLEDLTVEQLEKLPGEMES